MTGKSKAPSKSIALGEGAEFDTIRDLIARWGATASGIGDDAATLDLPRGERLVVSIDAFVIDRHFERDWLTPTEIGYRATAAALSDLAAMAAAPLGLLFAVNVPKDWRDKLGEIADGVAIAAHEAGTVIVGGNLSAAAELSIATTVLGSTFATLPRSGAQIGDHLYATGRLGGPGAAVAAWKSGREPDRAARQRFAHPTPRLREARWLADRGATSCIDISDGVVADARHIAAASGRQLEIHLDKLPVIDGVSAMDAARSGEEYELLVSASRVDTDAFATKFGIPLTDVGVVIPGDAGVTIVEHGARVAAIPGHDHFSK
jgi:thiamine-monophosphate kinase